MLQHVHHLRVPGAQSLCTAEGEVTALQLELRQQREEHSAAVNTLKQRQSIIDGSLAAKQADNQQLLGRVGDLERNLVTTLQEGEQREQVRRAGRRNCCCCVVGPRSA